MCRIYLWTILSLKKFEVSLMYSLALYKELLFINFLFWNYFKHTEMLQRRHRKLTYTFHPFLLMLTSYVCHHTFNHSTFKLSNKYWYDTMNSATDFNQISPVLFVCLFF